MKKDNIKPIRCPIIDLKIDDLETVAKFSRAIYNDGIWWRELFRGFCWPLDIQEIFKIGPNPPFTKRFIGYQHLTKKEGANCHLRFLCIEDLQNWGADRIHKKQRSVIRKSFENLILKRIDGFDEKEAEKAMFCWNNLVERTGWRKEMPKEKFFKYWDNLFKIPGNTIIGAYKDKELVGWLIGALYNNGHCYLTRYVSHGKHLNLSPNDALVYCFLLSAKAMGARIANFGLFAPQKPTLDKFKEHLGFGMVNFPAYIHLNLLAKIGIRIFKRKELARLTSWKLF